MLDSDLRRPSMRLRWAVLATSLAVLAAGTAVVLLNVHERGVAPQASEGLGRVGAFVRHVIFRFGVAGSLGLLYVEESGVPLPVPGDAYVLYLGHVASGSLVRQIAAALAIVVVVSAGATNMFMLTGAWGERLLRGRLGHTLHVTEARLATAERWLRRWGPLLIIFGRHPGFRIPITIVAGTLRVPYAVFLPCVAVSTSLWVTAEFLLQARFGPEVGRFAQAHRWTYVAVAGAVFLVASLLFRALRYRPPLTTSGADAGAPLDRE